jgi:hypothetical protein
MCKRVIHVEELPFFDRRRDRHLRLLLSIF